MAAAPKESKIVNGLVNSTRIKAKPIKMAKVIKASCTVILLVASGRFLVLSTNPSILRSAISLITQPADRISITPKLKIRVTLTSGFPPPEIQMAHRVGHNSNKVPMGRSKRSSCMKSGIREIQGVLGEGGSAIVGLLFT